jgi:hypothetical protein
MAGCGNSDVALHVECKEGPQAVQAALAKAPGEVRLGGSVKISDCFPNAASPADVQQVGATFVTTTDQLADRTRIAPHSRAAVELGYLIGAVRRGAGGGMGVHSETERRIEQSLVGLKTTTSEFRSGLAAGARTG